MNPAEITASVIKIFAARGRVSEPQINKVWVEGIIEFCAEKKASDADIQRGLTEYFRSTDQFPVLGSLLEKIKPQASSKATKDKEERMIDEYAAGNRSWDKLPQEMKDALNAIGGVFDYRNAKDGYQRAEWLKRYHAARETNEAGYVPEKHTALPPPPPAQPGGESEEARERVRARFEEFSKKQAAALEKLTANAAKLEK